ncbi:MAG TPA: ArsA-related P-loop ATPase [Candidatus Dormibacteraeota bacterium]|nr:ArsA-related P-loop ATPase [Candidatus Dormibacteraeota bacterium]
MRGRALSAASGAGGGAGSPAPSEPAAGVNLAARLAEREVIVCAGSGGVGKTTISAALGMAIVAEHDLRVLVLTVDPARRLATALGIESMGIDPVAVPRARLRKVLGAAPKGELVVAMLDMKSTWDRLVERLAPDRVTVERIFRNPFYQGISDAFIGSHEYMAMEALYELHTAREYDVLIIDTPPSRNALDFLEAPNRLGDFVGARLLAWLAGPTRVGFRAMGFAATPFLRMADRLLGSEMLENLSVFVRDLQGLYGGVQQRAREVYRLLRAPATAFVVVTTLEPAPFAEAEFFASKLHEFSMPLRALVVNRVLPESLRDREAVAAAASMEEDPSGAAKALSEVLGEKVPADAPRRIAEGFTLLSRLAERDSRQVQRLSRLGRVPVARLPLVDHDISDLEGLAIMAAGLRGQVPA